MPTRSHHRPLVHTIAHLARLFCHLFSWDLAPLTHISAYFPSFSPPVRARPLPPHLGARPLPTSPPTFSLALYSPTSPSTSSLVSSPPHPPPTSPLHPSLRPPLRTVLSHLAHIAAHSPGFSPPPRSHPQVSHPRPPARCLRAGCCDCSAPSHNLEVLSLLTKMIQDERLIGNFRALDILCIWLISCAQVPPGLQLTFFRAGSPSTPHSTLALAPAPVCLGGPQERPSTRRLTFTGRSWTLQWLGQARIITCSQERWIAGAAHSAQ